MYTGDTAKRHSEQLTGERDDREEESTGHWTGLDWIGLDCLCERGKRGERREKKEKRRVEEQIERGRLEEGGRERGGRGRERK